MQVNIKTFTDADFRRSFVYKTPALEPYDLTGHYLHMMVRAKAADATVFITATSLEKDWLSSDVTRIEITDAPNGKFRVTIGLSKLVNLPVGEFEQSLILVGPDGLRSTIWRGVMLHAAGPTRWPLGEI